MATSIIITRRAFLKSATITAGTLAVFNNLPAAEPQQRMLTDLTPTGRGGGLVSISEVSLDEVLRNYDAAYPDYTIMPRETVIAHYTRVQKEGYQSWTAL